jgi:uncharacterized protein (TIGR00255 family)
MGADNVKKKSSSISSMTGYGRGVKETSDGSVSVEVRSLNHRFLDVSIRAPKEFLYLDPELRKVARKRLSRGKVEIIISLEGKHSDLVVDIDRAAEAARGLAQVAEVVGDQVRLDHVLAVGDIVRSVDTSDPQSKAEIIIGAANEALDRLLAHREEEGRALGLDLFQRASYLRELKIQIEELAGSAPDRARKNITDYLQKIDMGGKIDPQRLEAEVALLAQRADVSEEITRLQAHLDSLEDNLKAGGTVGRRIDFILQEIQREVNTIGSKTGLVEISSLVVDFKSELEKIREQVQNIE